MTDLKNPKWMYAKAVLFVILGVMSFGILLCPLELWARVALQLVMIWAFARAYYFAFYVVGHYVDSSFKFAGLFDFLKYLARGSRKVLRSSAPPRIIAINPDGYSAQHVGHTSDGRQFFLTTPFEPATGGREGGEYVALYLFNEQGKLLDAKIDSLGPRGSMNDEVRRGLYEKRLHDLGDVSIERIEVAPFSVEHSGVTFGLVLRQPEEADDPWAVEAQPGNYMAFFEPWDRGDYDT